MKIELFSLALTIEALQVDICESRYSLNGVGHSEYIFGAEGSIVHKLVLVSEN